MKTLHKKTCESVERKVTIKEKVLKKFFNPNNLYYICCNKLNIELC
jgi:hypothetical protein